MSNRNGYATIYTGAIGHQRAHRLNLDRIQDVVTDLIIWGKVLQVEKTKSGRTDDLNGKNVVTIGPYQEATDAPGTKRYRMYIGPHDYYTSTSAYAVAQQFIRWVGRGLAREAVRDYARKH